MEKETTQIVEDYLNLTAETITTSGKRCWSMLFQTIHLHI